MRLHHLIEALPDTHVYDLIKLEIVNVTNKHTADCIVIQVMLTRPAGKYVVTQFQAGKRTTLVQ